jgi:3-oxoacyl-[acyl-carrier-protein] synthase-3
MRAAITATGHYLPPDVYPNAFFEKQLDTTDAWIRSRTGIAERHFASAGGTSDLIVPAAGRCLDARGVSATAVDCIIVATMTPDRLCPSTAAIVQRKLGATLAWGFDLAGACSGFVYGLIVATKLVESGAARRLLLCGADRMSSVIDPEDRATAVLFGDGAGAVLIEAVEDESVGILDHVFQMDGEGEAALYIPAGGSVEPATAESVVKRRHYVVQDGPAVFKAAVVGMADVTAEVLKRSEVAVGDLAWLVPHQANGRIIEAVAKRLGLGLDRVVINLDRYGNTVGATIPIALSEWHEKGQFTYGDRLVLSRSRLHCGERLPPLGHRLRRLTCCARAPATLRSRSPSSSRNRASTPSRTWENRTESGRPCAGIEFPISDLNGGSHVYAHLRRPRPTYGDQGPRSKNPRGAFRRIPAHSSAFQHTLG